MTGLLETLKKVAIKRKMRLRQLKTMCVCEVVEECTAEARNSDDNDTPSRACDRSVLDVEIVSVRAG